MSLTSSDGSSTPRVPLLTALVPVVIVVKEVDPAGAYARSYLEKFASVAVPTMLTVLTMFELFAGAVIFTFGSVLSLTVGCTVRSVLPEIPSLVARMLAPPSAAAEATPVDGLIVAAPESLLHVTWPDRFWLVPLVSTPV